MQNRPRDHAEPFAVVVDVANVMGSTPDGWWRDRRGAASRLLARLETLPEWLELDGVARRVERIVAVVEGEARSATGGPRVSVRVAPGSGDDTIVDVAREFAPGVLVVTADRGLRVRLPPGATAVGPRWLLDRLP